MSPATRPSQRMVGETWIEFLRENLTVRREQGLSRGSLTRHTTWSRDFFGTWSNTPEVAPGDIGRRHTPLAKPIATQFRSSNSSVCMMPVITKWPPISIRILGLPHSLRAISFSPSYLDSRSWMRSPRIVLSLR